MSPVDPFESLNSVPNAKRPARKRPDKAAIAGTADSVGSVLLAGRAVLFLFCLALRVSFGAIESQ